MADKAFQLSFDGSPAGELYADVQLVEVDESAARTTFTIRVGLALTDDGSWTHLDDPAFGLLTHVQVSMGFLGGAGQGLEPIADGYVTGARLHLGAEPGDAYLDVTGGDASVLLATEEKTVSWPNLADSDIARQILAGHGISARVVPTSPVRQEVDTLTVQRGSDAQFLRDLARRNGYQLSFLAGAETACYFGPPELDGAPQADLAVRFGDESNLAAFELSLHGLRPLAVSAMQLDARTKQATVVDAEEPALRSLGARSLTELVEPRLSTLVTPRYRAGRLLLDGGASAAATELQAAAQVVRDEAAWFLTASGEVNLDAYGRPLRPGLVLVKGAGEQFSGTYLVTRVVHRLSPDGAFRETFEARRNARDLDGTEQFGGGPAGLGLAAAAAAVGAVG